MRNWKKRLCRVKQNYNCSFTKREIIRIYGTGLLAMAAETIIFYRSFWGMAVTLPCFIFRIKKKHVEYQQMKREQLSQDFREVMVSVANAMGAGYSLENAFLEAHKEFELLGHNRTEDMVKELVEFEKKLKMNLSIIEILNDFAERTGAEDIQNFAQVVLTAKRNGGNLIKILHKTVDNITAKDQIKEEIVTMVTEKKLEQSLMGYMPMGIIAYLGITSPDYLAPLYGNLLGAFVATVGILLTQAAVALAGRLVEIEV